MNKDRGFVQIIIAVIVIVLILTFLRFDLRSLVESDTGQSNFGYLWELITKLWWWFWGLIIFVWDKFVGLLKDLTK